MKKSSLKEYQFTDNYLMRSPLFRKNKIEGIGDVLNFINTNKFKNALFISSPNLYNQIYNKEASKNGKYADKEIVTLLKYINRATNKSVPFGLFAGVSAKNWGQTKEEDAIKIHSRLDSRIYLELIDKLEKKDAIRHNLSYSLNNTLSKKNNNYYLIDNTRLYKNEIPKEIQVSSSDHLDKLANYLKTPKKHKELVKLLAGKDKQLEIFATEYLDELIESKVLLSELTPTILGEFSVEKILQKIYHINDESAKSIVHCLHEIDEVLCKFRDIDNDYAVLNNQLKAKLAKLNIENTEHSLVQIDTVFKSSEHHPGLKKNIQYNLKEAIALQYLIHEKFVKNIKNPFPHLKGMIERRFGHELVPINILFNGQYGNDYIFTGEKLNTPFAQLALSSKQTKHNNIQSNDSYKSFLRDIYKKNAGNEVVDLSKEIDYKGAMKKAHKLPYSMCVYGSPASNDNFLLRAVPFHGGKLVNRFSFCNTDIKHLVQNISNSEETAANLDNIDLMDLDFIPARYLSNVSQRSKSYENILSFLTSSNEPFNTIKLSDIGIQFDYYTKDLILYNLKNGRRVLPILNCALVSSKIRYQILKFIHTLTFSYYEFEFIINWKAIEEEYDYFPRIMFKNIILQPQAWILRKSDISTIFKSDNRFTRNYLKSKGIPAKFYIKEGDDDGVFCNLDEYYAINFFKSIIKGKHKVLIHEDLYEHHNLSEVILPLVKTSK